MPILLFRVDERLIHGQVVVGWGSQLLPDRYIVVDEILMGSEWERELYALGAPEGAEVIFSGVEEARSRMQEWKDATPRTIVLTRDLETMARLARRRLLEGVEVNLGGLHFTPGREEVLPYLYLSEGDRELLEEISAEGALVSARDLPGSSRVPLASLLE